MELEVEVVCKNARKDLVPNCHVAYCLCCLWPTGPGIGIAEAMSPVETACEHTYLVHS